MAQTAVPMSQAQVRSRSATPTGLKAAKAKPKMFAFIASDADGRSPSNTRKFIRSHVMRGKNTRKRSHVTRMPTPSSSPSPVSDTTETFAGPTMMTSSASTLLTIEKQPSTEASTPDNAADNAAEQMSYDPSSTLPDYLPAEDDEAVTDILCGEVSKMRISPTTYVCVAGRRSNGAPEGVALRMASLPGPLNFPSNTCAFAFAEDLGFDGQRLVHDFFSSLKRSLYPLELCTKQSKSDDYWYRWLLDDAAYLNSALFNVSAFHDIIAYRSRASGPSRLDVNTNLGDVFSPRSWKFLRRTIKLLQERIEDKEEQLKDSTAAVIVSLALTAELIGDDKAFNVHVQGLNSMVRMRGGLDSFPVNSKMQVKICRVDLGWSVKTGSKPQLRGLEDISWSQICDGILREQKLEHVAVDSTVQPLLHLIDEKLYNIFIDIRKFSCLANYLGSNKRKLHPSIFEDIMVSIQYRLLLLEYECDEQHRLEEALRLSLLTYQFTLYRQTPGIKAPYDLLSKQLRAALYNLDVSHPMLADLQLWMFFVGAMVVLDTADPWLITCIKDLIGDAGWPETQDRLRGIMWIDALNSDSGKWLYDAIRPNFATWSPPLG